MIQAAFLLRVIAPGRVRPNYSQTRDQSKSNSKPSVDPCLRKGLLGKPLQPPGASEGLLWVQIKLLTLISKPNTHHLKIFLTLAKGFSQKLLDLFRQSHLQQHILKAFKKETLLSWRIDSCFFGSCCLSNGAFQFGFSFCCIHSHRILFFSNYICDIIPCGIYVSWHGNKKKIYMHALSICQRELERKKREHGAGHGVQGRNDSLKDKLAQS